MKRCDVIEKHYKNICDICRSLTSDWEDLCHDLCEYFLTCKADIVEIDSRGKFQSYVCGAALRKVASYRIRESEKFGWLVENEKEDLNVDEIIKRLSDKDLKILSIFATGATLTSVSEKIFVDRHTLSKHLKEAQRNAKRIINEL